MEEIENNNNISFSEKIVPQEIVFTEKELKIQDDEKISNIISSLINFKAKAYLNSLFKIINNKKKQILHEIFIQLMSKTKYGNIDYKKSKINLKKIIILSKIKSQINKIFQIYKYYRLKKLQKFFQKWKYITSINKYNNILEKNISDKINKLYESKIISLNKDLKIKQKNLEELKEQERNFILNNKQIEKEKDVLIKNEKKLAQKIEQIEKENIILEKEKKPKNNSSQNFYSKKDEEKIKELENKLKELEEEEIERKNYMNQYSEEMGKIMGVFEQKAEEIMRLQNMGQIRRRLDSGNSTLPTMEFNSEGNQ